MLHVLIADDHTVVRQGLMQIVAKSFGGEVEFAEAKDVKEALAHARRQPLDLAILDVTMPGRSGLDVIGEIKQLRPKLPVVVLSMHAEDIYAERALKAGASAYITKERAAEELIAAIKKVLSGGRYVSPQLAEKWAFSLAEQAEKEPHENLSAREFEILRLIASGQKPRDIAETLRLSVKTVASYRARILDKLALKTTADLIRYALIHKLVD